MTDGNDKLAKRYREMAREEPGAALDAAILAASRRPAPRQSWASRWGAPVSIAAVLILAFGLTLEMRQEQPGVETSAPAPRPAAPSQPAKPAAPAEQEQLPAPAAAPEPPAKPQVKARAAPAAPEPARAPEPFPQSAPQREERAPAADLMRAPAPALAPAAPASPAAAAPAPSPPAAAGAMRMAPQSTLNAAPASRAKSAAGASAQGAIEAELERIAQLRAQGRDGEADAALEQFRRDHPGYEIAPAIWERVKPR